MWPTPRYTVNFLKAGGFIFTAVADEAFGRQVSLHTADLVHTLSLDVAHCSATEQQQQLASLHAVDHWQ